MICWGCKLCFIFKRLVQYVRYYYYLRWGHKIRGKVRSRCQKVIWRRILCIVSMIKGWPEVLCKQVREFMNLVSLLCKNWKPRGWSSCLRQDPEPLQEIILLLIVFLHQVSRFWKVHCNFLYTSFTQGPSTLPDFWSWCCVVFVGNPHLQGLPSELSR